MTAHRQPEDNDRSQKKIRNFSRYIYETLKSTSDAELAEDLFRLTVLMSTRREFRQRITAVLRQAQAAKTEPGRKLESSLEDEMTETLSQTQDYPLEQIVQRLQSQFFEMMKKHSINIPRAAFAGHSKRPSFFQYVVDLYSKKRKNPPTGSAQIKSFAKNCSVQIYTQAAFTKIAGRISEIEYIGALLSTDQVLFILYETSKGFFFVQEKEG